MQLEEVINNATQTCYGSEGTVYIHKDYAYKIFRTDKEKEFIKKKEKKIEILKNLDLDGFITPIDKVFNKDDFIGYKMNKVNNEIDIYEICNKYKEKYTLDQKIEYLLEVEKLIKKAHNNNIILNDCATWNFIVEDNNRVIGIDTDNFQINDLKSELTQIYYLPYYKTLTNTLESSQNSDKFSFALYALRSLMKNPFETEAMHKYNIRLNDNLKMIFKYLDISEEAKEEIYDLLSNNSEKEWIGKTLTKFSSNKRKYLL